MGIDRNLHIGPYVLATEVVTKKRIDQCAGCKRPDDAKYCPTCGSAQRFVEQERGTAPDGWEEDYPGGFDNFLTNTAVMCEPFVMTKNGKRIRVYTWLPNQHCKELGVENDVNWGDESATPLEEVDIEAMIAKFRKLFSKELKHLEQWFDVSVHWGVVTWCS